MTFNLSWKGIVGLVLVAVSTVIGIMFNVPIATISAIVGAVVGCVVTIEDAMSKVSISGWQKWVFLVTLIAGVVVFAIGGYSASTIMEIIGAIVLIASVIFGIVVESKKK